MLKTGISQILDKLLKDLLPKIVVYILVVLHKMSEKYWMDYHDIQLIPLRKNWHSFGDLLNDMIAY